MSQKAQLSQINRATPQTVETLYGKSRIKRHAIGNPFKFQPMRGNISQMVGPTR